MEKITKDAASRLMFVFSQDKIDPDLDKIRTSLIEEGESFEFYQGLATGISIIGMAWDQHFNPSNRKIFLDDPTPHERSTVDIFDDFLALLLGRTCNLIVDAPSAKIMHPQEGDKS